MKMIMKIRMSSFVSLFLVLLVNVNCLVFPTDANNNPMPGAIETFYVNPQQVRYSIIKFILSYGRTDNCFN